MDVVSLPLSHTCDAWFIFERQNDIISGRLHTRHKEDARHCIGWMVERRRRNWAYANGARENNPAACWELFISSIARSRSLIAQLTVTKRVDNNNDSLIWYMHMKNELFLFLTHKGARVRSAQLKTMAAFKITYEIIWIYAYFRFFFFGL